MEKSLIDSRLNSIKDYIYLNEIDRAFDILITLTDDIISDFKDEVIIMVNRYTRIKRDIRLELISKDEEMRLITVVIKGILDIIREIEKVALKDHRPSTAGTWIWLNIDKKEFNEEFQENFKNKLSELLHIDPSDIKFGAVENYKSIIVYTRFPIASLYLLGWMVRVDHVDYIKLKEEFKIEGYIAPN